MKSIFKIFHRGLQKTATSLSRKISGIFTGAKTWDDATFEELEAALISSDFGVRVATRLVEDLRDRYQRGLIAGGEDINAVAREEIASILTRSYKPFTTESGELKTILMVGVNGSGKTTTSGKLARLLKEDGRSVMLAACDTFRAAAVEQLKLWGERVDCPVVASSHGADPSAVAYDAVQAGLSRKRDYLIIDTAGRQHTKKGLMDELLKMRRAIGKLKPGAPEETWLVLDGSVGSNALAQAKEFCRVVDVNGLVFTKLDGSGKGGMVVAVSDEFDLPVYFVGLGESPEDLQPFDPEMFATAMFEG